MNAETVARARDLSKWLTRAIGGGRRETAKLSWIMDGYSAYSGCRRSQARWAVDAAILMGLLHRVPLEQRAFHVGLGKVAVQRAGLKLAR